MILNRILWVLLVLTSTSSWGQTTMDSTQIIQTIEVKAQKIRTGGIGSTTAKWDSPQLTNTIAGNIATLLQTEAGVFIKSYGLGSLATSSVRGGSAGHTLVLWNGIPIHSPMLGLLDLSLLSINVVDAVQFQKGGNGALWGSGAIGGVLSMDNEVDFSNTLNLSVHSLLGAFGTHQQDLKIGVGSTKFQSKTRFSYRSANNDFTYRLRPQLPKQKQTNAALENYNFLQEFYFRPNLKNDLSVYFWRQYSDRQIPPTTTQNKSEAYQIDRSNRLILNWKHRRKHSFWNSKLAYFDEDIDYFDPQTLLEALSNFKQLTAETTRNWFWKDQHHFLAGTTYLFSQATADGYRGKEEEHRVALFASYRWSVSKWQTQLAIRQGFRDIERLPVLPVFSVDYKVNSNIELKAKISRNYRLPTLNDRFWRPGGNPNLLPETGWSQEVTAISFFGKNRFQYQITGFNRQIENWILWSRKKDQLFWSSNNITKVWSRGIEQSLEFSQPITNGNLQFITQYSYIKSTNQVALETPRIARGQQLFYTPEHQLSFNTKVHWKTWQWSFQQIYTGATTGINEDVDSYWIANTRVQYQINKHKWRSTVFLNLHNILNTNYYVIERRPMPGRYIEGGIQFNFNQ